MIVQTIPGNRFRSNALSFRLFRYFDGKLCFLNSTSALVSMLEMVGEWRYWQCGKCKWSDEMTEYLS